MQKLALVLTLLLLSFPVKAASENGTSELDNEISKMNIITPEQEAKIQKRINKHIFYKLNNYSPKELETIAKFSNQLDKRYHRITNQEYKEPEALDGNDKIGMKYFLKKDINLEIARPSGLMN